MTWSMVSTDRRKSEKRGKGQGRGCLDETYGNAVGVLLTNAFGFCLALLEGMFVLELGTHVDGWRVGWKGCLEGGD